MAPDSSSNHPCLSGKGKKDMVGLQPIIHPGRFFGHSLVSQKIAGEKERKEGELQEQYILDYICEHIQWIQIRHKEQ